MNKAKPLELTDRVVATSYNSVQTKAAGFAII